MSFIFKETKEYYSHTGRPGIDPDARVAKKSNKPRMLSYSATMAVDTEKNVITHMAAEHSSKRDSRLLLDTVESTPGIYFKFTIPVRSRDIRDIYH